MLRTIAGSFRAARFLILALAALTAFVAVGPAQARHTNNRHAKHKNQKQHKHKHIARAQAKRGHDWNAPTAPPNLTGTPGDQKVDLAWGASTDNVGVAGYRVYRNAALVATVAPTTRSYTDAPLANGVPDSYYVKAYDGAGRLSPASNQVTVTPSGSSAPGGSTGPTGPTDGYTVCANEYQQCSFSGTKEVIYGAGQNFTSPRQFTGGVLCDNSVFGDPAVGADKTCYMRDVAGGGTPGTGGGTPGTGTGSDASGQNMPVGDIPGWHQIFTDDFTQNVPLGSFPESVSGKWGAYPCCWSGTPTWAHYDPHATTSLHDGQMDMWLHNYAITAPIPKINGSGADDNQLYGRYVIRFKADNFAGYHASFLLWPKSERWPTDGEIDFPEGDYNSHIDAFMHRQGGTSGGDQDAYSTSIPMAGAWHTAAIDWLPNHLTLTLDGQVIGNSTSRVPNTPMHWIIQNGGTWGTQPPASAGGHVYVDWVAVYRPA